MLLRTPFKGIQEIANTITSEDQRNNFRAKYKVIEPGLALLVNDLLAMPVSPRNSLALVEALHGQYSLLQCPYTETATAVLRARLVALEYNDMLEKHHAGQYDHKRGAMFIPNRTHQVTEAVKFGNRR